MIEAADLQADARVLRAALEALHPGLYRYNNVAQMNAWFASLQHRFSRDLTLSEAYLVLSEFAAEIRCGHTYPNFFNQTDAVAAALFAGRNRVPFYFRWLDKRMIVTRDFTPERALPRGTEVTAIDGVAVADILTRLMQVARADGGNDAKRIADLEVAGRAHYEAFDVYFPLYFPAVGKRLILRVVRPGNTAPRVVDVAALTDVQRAAAAENGKANDAPLFTWRYLTDGSAYLGMPRWSVYNSTWNWRAWLDGRLDEAARRRAPALIIDLRGNEGGSDVGNEILSRLVKQDLHLARYRRLVRYVRTPPALDPYLHSWDKGFRDWGDAARTLDKPWPTAPAVPYFALDRAGEGDAGTTVIHPAGVRFQGQVYVLVDATNSSATFTFVQAVQQNRLGVLVGEPTGGNLRGIDGGAFFFLRLPHSGLEMDVPLIGMFPATPQPDAGLTPDIVVTTTMQDIVAGRDADLARIGVR